MRHTHLQEMICFSLWSWYHPPCFVVLEGLKLGLNRPDPLGRVRVFGMRGFTVGARLPMAGCSDEEFYCLLICLIESGEVLIGRDEVRVGQSYSAFRAAQFFCELGVRVL